jgi:hypothetical protein
LFELIFSFLIKKKIMAKGYSNTPDGRNNSTRVGNAGRGNARGGSNVSSTLVTDQTTTLSNESSSSVSRVQQNQIRDVDDLLGRINTTKRNIDETNESTITEAKVNEWITQVGDLQTELNGIRTKYEHTAATLNGYSGKEQGFENLINKYKTLCQNSSAKRGALLLKDQLSQKETLLRNIKTTLTTSKQEFMQRITTTNNALQAAKDFINQQKCWENIKDFVSLVNSITVERSNYNLEGLGDLFQDRDRLDLVITLAGTNLKNNNLTINIEPLIEENQFKYYKLLPNYSIEETSEAEAETDITNIRNITNIGAG